MSGPVDVLARYEAERASELAQLQALIEAGVVTQSEKELADLTKWHREAVEARAAVAELIERADNAEKIIRNCVNAGQIGAGYMQHADELRGSIDRVGGAK